MADNQFLTVVASKALPLSHFLASLAASDVLGTTTREDKAHTWVGVAAAAAAAAAVAMMHLLHSPGAVPS